MSLTNRSTTIPEHYQNLSEPLFDFMNKKVRPNGSGEIEPEYCGRVLGRTLANLDTQKPTMMEAFVDELSLDQKKTRTLVHQLMKENPDARKTARNILLQEDYQAEFAEQAEKISTEVKADRVNLLKQISEAVQKVSQTMGVDLRQAV